MSRLRILLLVTFLSAIPVMGGPILSVQAPTLPLTVGENFTVDVVVNAVTDLYAWQFDLGFDPTILAVDNVIEGPFLEEGGSTFFIPGTIDDVGGSVSNNADTLLTAVFGVSGSGTLVTFDLTALAPGVSSLSAFYVVLLDSSLTEIDATVQNSSATVSGATTPEPGSFGLLVAGGLVLLICVARRRLAKVLLWLAPIVCFGQVFDTTPPTLVGFSFAPTSVNVTSGPQNVVVSLHVTDDLSGVLSSKAYVSVSFQCPSGHELQGPAYGSSLPGSTPLNATFQATITIPEFSESGNWTVAGVQLSDAVGNTVNLNTAALSSMFFPTVLNVTSVPDTTPPTLTSLTFVPSSINVSNTPQPVTVSARSSHVTRNPGRRSLAWAYVATA